jgi:hypothetical protein
MLTAGEGIPLMYCTVGWVDIGTGARVPLKFVVCLKKVGKITQKCA